MLYGRNPMANDNYYWRLFGTGLGFVLFGMGGLVLSMFVFPLIFITIHSNTRRQRVSRLVIYWAFGIFLNLMRMLGLISFQIEGAEKLTRKGVLIIANHPSLIDVVFLMSFIKDVNCIVKQSLIRNLFVRSPMLAARYIANENPEAMINNSVKVLKNNESLIVFPEGTRSVPGVSPKFYRGAAHIAYLAKCPVVPVTIHCDGSGLSKAEPWYHIPKHRIHFAFRVGQDIPPLQNASRSTIIGVREINQTLMAHFNPEI